MYSFKKEFKLEGYVLLFENYKHRREFTKLKISSHSLQIEKRDTSKNPYKRMVLFICTAGDVEDEMYFLMKC